MSVPAQDQGLNLGEKTVKELIEPGTAIEWDGTDGTITGQLKKVEAWEEWGAPEGGHFFPLKLDSRYDGKSVTVEGTVKRSATDLLWVLKVDEAVNASKKFTITAEDLPPVTLDASKATLA